MTVNTNAQKLIKNLQSDTPRIGVVGLGYVGLPLAVAFAREGCQVVGVDIGQSMVDALNKGESHIGDIPSDVLAPFVESGNFVATTDFQQLETVSAICICVPTPMGHHWNPDLSYVVSAGKACLPYAKGKYVALESTIYPSGTEECFNPIIEELGYTVGEDLFLGYSPERIDPGRVDHTIRTTPKVVGGATDACLEIGKAVYDLIVDEVVPVRGIRTAEMVKILENTFRLVNIGFINEFAQICESLDIDVWEVINAAATKPYGFMKFTPGPGLGGHCIPIDPHYLNWIMREKNTPSRFIDLSAEINHAMPSYVIGRLASLLNDSAMAMRGSNIVVMGVAYKPNISDMRESPAIEIVDSLLATGAAVTYHDPHVPTLRVSGGELKSAELTEELIAQADAVLIITNHKAVDYQLLADHASLIFDTRNSMNIATTGRYESL